MEGVIFGLFALSFILLISMIHHIRSIWRPGISRSRNLLMRRAKVLGIAGSAILLFAVLLLYR
ncbi:hypothetical protein F9802_15415 [Bacillus aerolatus]|uniref:Uncharacterized protein n=1 Tax=Bacillus aerolatus TaxID=2653354 RepID=A0A6I1FH75_9BACI|nr:hypothetical protein [Bacillus aerolatus]KAB7704950.1 hypothetical protein F9802_15415 [Bacillus aerolatus]